MLILPVAVVALLMVSATLAASETAIFALARLEGIREKLSQPVRYAVNRLMRRPFESLMVVIGLNEAANIFAESLATIFLLTLLGPKGEYVALPLMFFVVLIFCDITPKTFALGYPEGIARLTAGLLAALTEVIHPLTRHFTPFEEAPRLEPVSESEFKALLRVSENLGEVEPGERALIHRVFDFGTRRVSEVMTPRERIFSIDIETPPEELMPRIVHGHFSRVPVYRRNPDNVVGILNAKDMVIGRLEPSPPRIERLIRRPYFIPPGKLVGELFQEMRRERVWLALVVDEYGKLLGLVTVEDLLEELFGELRDEFDFEGPELSQVGENEWLASGAIDVAELNRRLDDSAELPPPGGARTLSALILRQLRRVPRAGENLRIGKFEATVERVRGATVELARLRRCS
jgi:CBS domain containing-hemolysin-like protein